MGVWLVEIYDFLAALGVIIMIDLILGGDNAIVIALATRNLPAEKRNTAIWIGTGLAIGVRVVITLIAVWLLQIKFLMLIGGLFLVWIAIKLLLEDKEDSANIKAEYTLSAAIKTIVIADIVMGVDNVLAIAGASKGSNLLVVLGLLISVPIIIWGSKLILHFIEKYPVLIYIGSAVLAYTAGTMITHEITLQNFIASEPYLNWLIPVFVIAVVLLFGYVRNLRIKQSKTMPSN